MSYAYNQNNKAAKLAKKLNPPEVIAVDKVEKVKKEISPLKNFRVTFTINNKLHPVTRTVTIKTTDKQNAELQIHQRFGSIMLIKFKKITMPTVPSNEISISRCVEIDADGNEVVENTTTEEQIALNSATEPIAEEVAPATIKKTRKKKNVATDTPVLAEA
jgi:hypothetical protein